MGSPPPLSKLEDVFGNVVTSLLALGGIVLFLMLLSGGFKYLTSGGDAKLAEGAQKTLTYAIGGLVLLAGSYMILRIISDFTGADVTNFVIYKP
ncbi:MAG: pilin [Patescibacteria group bacterium]